VGRRDVPGVGSHAYDRRLEAAVGTPEYHRHRQRPQDDGAAAKAILQRHHAPVMFVGPKLEAEILASNAKHHVKN
jgi:hypothetical protein